MTLAGLALVLAGAAWQATAAAAGLNRPAVGHPPGRVAELAYVSGARAPRVWLASVTGSRRRPLGVGESTLISPNGQIVATTPVVFSGPAVTLLSVAGSIIGRFYDAAVLDAHPVAWSPDSRYLAVILLSGAARSNQSGLAVIDTLTGRSVTIARGGISGASFAPAGPDRLTYGWSSSVSFSSPQNLFIALPDGSRVRRLTRDGRSADPAWGVRGIAFDRASRHPGASRDSQLWLIRPDGRGLGRLTDSKQRGLAYGLTPLAFSANGERLLAAYEGNPVRFRPGCSTSGPARRGA